MTADYTAFHAALRSRRRQPALDLPHPVLPVVAQAAVAGRRCLGQRPGARGLASRCAQRAGERPADLGPLLRIGPGRALVQRERALERRQRVARPAGAELGEPEALERECEVGVLRAELGLEDLERLGEV